MSREKVFMLPYRMIGRQDKRKTTLGIVHSYDDPATVLHHVPAMAVGSASIPPKMLKTILFAISGVFFFRNEPYPETETESDEAALSRNTRQLSPHKRVARR